eukprot:jgi/Psemu1/7070/gm1.7070_g
MRELVFAGKMAYKNKQQGDDGMHFYYINPNPSVKSKHGTWADGKSYQFVCICCKTFINKSCHIIQTQQNVLLGATNIAKSFPGNAEPNDPVSEDNEAHESNDKDDNSKNEVNLNNDNSTDAVLIPDVMQILKMITAIIDDNDSKNDTNCENNDDERALKAQPNQNKLSIRALITLF